MNDADIEQARLESVGNTISVLKKKGICLHASRQGPGDPLNPSGMAECLDCGKKATWSELDEDMHAYL